MKLFWRYAGASGAVVLGLALVLVWLLDAAADRAVWIAAGVAYPVQLAAFGTLLAWQRRPNGVLKAMVAGTVLRFGAVAALGGWVWVTGGAPPAPLLLGLVGFLFLLMLMEPVFFIRQRTEG